MKFVAERKNILLKCTGCVRKNFEIALDLLEITTLKISIVNAWIQIEDIGLITKTFRRVFAGVRNKMHDKRPNDSVTENDIRLKGFGKRLAKTFILLGSNKP